ncbi:hybrid sensor histidine kinase/response regulator [Paludibacterium yongneupense]|uniref:hybrid sensor histidine kinase/response regulator n=1 Tax=Paludibacterium yongneupense TaxID=400061 RepID=UPI00041F26A0|nr:PAS domain S-box protein [Paludibacterium yongneupense]
MGFAGFFRRLVGVFGLHTRYAMRDAALLDRIIEAVSNAVVLVRSNGTIAYTNSHCEEWFAYPRDELIGRPIEMLVPERYRTQHLSDRTAFLHAASHRAMGTGRELFARRKDGSEFPVEIGLSPLTVSGETLVLASIVDLSERRKSEERFRLMVEAAPNAMVMVDASGRIVLVNSQAETCFGYSRQELLGMNVDMLLPQRYRERHGSYRETFMHDASTRAMGAGRDLYGRRKDGSEFPIEIGLNPLQTAEGTMVLSAIIDISERKAVEQRFREHAEQVSLASRYKSEFMANMSHELRTPLNSILLLSEQLRDGQKERLTPRQSEFADIIHKSGEDLLALINDILDLSRIEAGRMPVHPEKVILADFIAHLREVLRPMADSRQIRLSFEMEPDTPAVVVIDFQRVYQIVKNLFSNAVKFSDSGGQVHLRMLHGPGHGQFSIAVTDTGPGIPADKHEMIFQAFQQLDGSVSRKVGGSGLGLAISRQLATLLGGELTLDSQPGLGSTFTLSLPLSSDIEAPPPAISPPALPALPEDGETRTFKILIVEDDTNFAEVMAESAREHDFDPHVRHTGRDCQDALAQLQPDAMIVDILLPDMSGWKLIEGVRHDPQLGGMPIQIITCLDRPSTVTEAAGYLVKPVDTLQLARVFSNLRRQLLQAAPPPPPLPQPDSDTTERPERTILLVDDDIRNVYAMSSLLEDAGMAVHIARNGEEALRAVAEHTEIDLVLMDMMMPVLDGYQATAFLRRDLKFDKPILAVTASAMKGDREKCLEAGANDYLAKPVSSSVLLERIKQLLC